MQAYNCMTTHIYYTCYHSQSRTRIQSETHMQALISHQIKSSAHPDAGWGWISLLTLWFHSGRDGELERGSTHGPTTSQGEESVNYNSRGQAGQTWALASAGLSNVAVTVSPDAHRPLRWLIVEERMTGDCCRWLSRKHDAAKSLIQSALNLALLNVMLCMHEKSGLLCACWKIKLHVFP